MKKKVIVPIILILVISVIGFIFWNNRIVSVITLDINPSIEINLNKSEKVVSVKALNNDAKEIIPKDMKSKSLNDVLITIVKNITDKNYVDENNIIDIILYSKGSVSNKGIEDNLHKLFEEKSIHSNIIVVEKLTKEDKTLAKKYNVSPAKISYIKEITNKNKSISIDNLVERSVNELQDTKDNGWYCDKDYIVEGNHCFKEISREDAIYGEKCPDGYYEYNGKCYEEAPILESDILICSDEFSLKNNKCYRKEEINAESEYVCDKGDLIRKGDVNPIGSPDNDKVVCVDKSTGKAPTLRCLVSSYHIVIDGKCYNGPAPTINGGCPNGDTLINGGCYSKDDEDQWQCPNGNIYEKSKGTFVDLCPDTFTYTEPKITSYNCPEGYSLNDNKCIKEETEDARHEMICPNGYTKVNNDRCINYDKIKDKENGYVCRVDNSKIFGNTCVIYEIIEAKQ